MNISLIATLLKRVGAICLAFVILWHVTNHSAPRRGKAIVHVRETDSVVVSIDHADYFVESVADTPVVCELEPGTHVAQVWRRGVLRGEQRFQVEPGEEIVVPAFDIPVVDRNESDTPQPRVESGGLAVRLPRQRLEAVPN